MNIRKVLKNERLKHLHLKPAVTVSPDTPLSEVISKMQEGKTGCATIVENEKVKGVFTERDVVTKVLSADRDLSTPVREFMIPDPHVLGPDSSIAKAIEVINRYGHRSIPVVDGKNNFLGLISVRSIINFLTEHFPEEVYNLPPKHDVKPETPEGG